MLLRNLMNNNKNTKFISFIVNYHNIFVFVIYCLKNLCMRTLFTSLTSGEEKLRPTVLLITAVSLPRIYSTCRSTQCMGNSSSQDMPPPVTVAAQARHTATVSSCFHPMTGSFTI